jgi:pyrroloquinoline-quinone synthase
MDKTQSFAQQIDAVIAKYDLLCHPFYQAWSMGELTRDSISRYACYYYPHVAAFPGYLGTLAGRLPQGEVREMVLSNKEDEEAPQARSHADLWVDFACGMGASEEQAKATKELPEMSALVEHFNNVAQTGSTVEALAAFYAYESQIPRVAAEKEAGLKQRYGADDRTAYYFTLHKAYDIQHSKTWLELLEKQIAGDEKAHKAALEAAESAAKSLWQALDGIEQNRVSQLASSRN